MKNYRNSISVAIQGIKYFFKREFNARLHIVFAAAAILVSAFSDLSVHEWMWIILAITLVLVSEMFNTAIELLCDMLSTERHPKIKEIKDISAAAVLTASIFAIITALLILLPKWI